MKPDIYLAATISTLPEHSLYQVGFICSSLLLSGGWTEPDKVYVPSGIGYAICEISTASPVKTKTVEAVEATAV